MTQVCFIAYRQLLLSSISFLKLSSIWQFDNPIDIAIVDQINHKYRFTITYLLQSSIFNYSASLYTKTDESLAIISVQSLYPAFN